MEEGKPMSKEKLEMVPLIKIKADQKKNPRKKEDKATFEELVKSINDKGVVVPVIIRPDDNHFELVCGFRRLKAVQALKMESIPAIVRDDLDEKGAAEIRTIENLQRENLDILDEAAEFKKLLTEFNWQIKDVADRIGKSEIYIRKRLILLKTPAYVQAAVAKNKITLGHAMILSNIQNAKEQKELFDRIGWMDLTTKGLYQSVTDRDKRINKNTPFDISACQGCKWLGVGQRELPLDELGSLKSEGDICTNKSCYNKKVQDALDAIIKKYKEKGFQVEAVESLNWRWKEFDKKTKEALVDPQKCEGCAEHFIIIEKGEGERIERFTVHDVCKKGSCKNWKFQDEQARLSKKEKERKKKENEKKDEMVKEIMEKIDQDEINLLVIRELISGGYAAIAPPYRAFAKIFEIDIKGFPKYDWGKSFLSEIAKRDPKIYPGMIKVLIILKLRYAIGNDLQDLHKQVVGAKLKQRTKEE